MQACPNAGAAWLLLTPTHVVCHFFKNVAFHSRPPAHPVVHNAINPGGLGAKPPMSSLFLQLFLDLFSMGDLGQGANVSWVWRSVLAGEDDVV